MSPNLEENEVYIYIGMDRQRWLPKWNSPSQLLGVNVKP